MANYGDNTVSVISGSTNTVVATVPVSYNPYAIAFDPNNGDVYVAGSIGSVNDSSVSVIDGSTNTVVASVPDGYFAKGIVFDPNNGNVYVVAYGQSPSNGTVTVINGSTNTLLTTIPVGVAAYGIAFDPNNGGLYVVNQTDGTVSVIDGGSNTVVATVPVGSAPFAITFNPGNGDMYVANYGGGSVSVLSPSATMSCSATFTPDGNTTEGTYTMSASFSGDSNYSASSSPQSNNFSITEATSSTSVSLTSGTDPSTYGTALTFTASVGGEYGQVKGAKRNRRAIPNTPGANVSWSANTGCAETAVPTLPAQVTCTTSLLPVGSPTVTATYSGDSNHSGSNGSVQQTVNPLVVVTPSPTSVSFGNVKLNEKKEEIVTLTQNGTGKVSIGTVSIINVTGNPSDFSFKEWCNGGILGLGKGLRCQIGVIFKPSQAIAESATLNVIVGASNSPVQVQITGTGVAAPTVTSLSTTTGPVAGGTPVTIYGTGFVAGATVHFGTALAKNVTVVSPTEITATTGAAPHPGTVTVTVKTAEGLGSLADAFTYTKP